MPRGGRRPAWPLRVLILFGLLACAAGRVAAQTPAPPSGAAVAIDGTHVALVPPPGFVVSAQFSGLEDLKTHASILIVEMPPEAYGGVAAAFTPRALATRGLSVTRQSRLDALAEENLFVEATQTVGSLRVGKLLLLVQGAPVTVLLNGNVPATPAQADTLEAMIAAYRTLEIRDDAQTMPLPFSLTYQGAFEERQRLAGQTVLYTETRSGMSLAPPEPLLVIAPSLGNPRIDDLKTAAGKLFKAIDAVAGQVVTSASSIMVAGLDGWEIAGAAADAQTGAPTFVYQALLLGPDRYFRLVGAAPLGEEAHYAEEFRKITRGFLLTSDSAEN